MTKKRKNKCDPGVNFIAPDGGWGWIVCISCGLTCLVSQPVRQTLGLIFRERFLQLKITNSQITTIINSQQALASFSGLIHGPIYRQFTIRQVALISSIFMVIGILMLAYSHSFLTFFLSFSLVYGFSSGFNKSSSFLSLNTYFKKFRKKAHSLTLTISAIGPIVMPQIVNILLVCYGVEGTVIIFAGIAMNGIAFALVNHPVQWHSNKSLDKITIINNINNKNDNLTESTKSKTFNDNESIKSVETFKTLVPVDENFDSSYGSTNSLEQIQFKTNLDNSTLTIIENDEIQSSTIYSCMKKVNENLIIDENKLQSCCNSFVKFFEFDLFKDFSYVNIIFGFALTTFTELNFNVLTPFFLSDFGLTNDKIALAMSTLGITEIIIRFLIPFVTAKIYWNNRIFFMIGVSGMTLCRIAIAQNPSFSVILMLFSFMGASRALRTIFMGLVLPDCVPLFRLPAAQGLQLLSSGMFSLFFGPAVGLLRDATDYRIVLYFLSGLSSLTILSWTIEMIFKHRKSSIKQKFDNCDKFITIAT